jgi:tetratricopeptide (TPR) repeat protein
MSEDHINIKNVRGDVIGAGVSGTGNFVGKEIHYTVKGNVFNIDNPSVEALQEFKKVLLGPAAIQSYKDDVTENARTLPQLKSLEGRMDEILKLVKSMDDKLGTNTTEIRVAGFHISRVELLVKRAIVLMEQASLYLNIVARDSNINWYKSKYKQALYILRQANTVDPYNTEVLLYMAKAQTKLIPNNSHAIRKILYRILNLLQAPKSDTEKYQLGEATFLLAVCGERISNEPLLDARTIFRDLGRNDWVRKCDDLLRSLDDKSDDANLWTEKAWTLGKLGKYDQAIECFDKAININANDAKIWRGKGSVLARLGKYELAIGCYAKGLEIDPSDAGLLKSEGTCFYYMEKYQQALDCFEKALEIGQDENTLIGKARILRKLGLYCQAIEAYDMAIKLNPNNVETYLGKGEALRELENYEESINCYDKSIQIDPDNPIVWFGKGEALRKIGMDEEALMCYDKTIEIDPENSAAWHGKGEILGKLSIYDRSKECLQKAKELGLTS